MPSDKSIASLSKKIGRKPGGQKGREGKTLQMVSDPDKIIDHSPEYYKCCGLDLGSMPGILIGRRQEIDIPPITPVVTEHRVYEKQCNCGHVTKSSFPGGITAPVSYGPMIESLTGYFHSRQYIPFLRMQELFRDIFSVPISEGGIHYLLNRFSSKALPVYHKIKDMVTTSYALPIYSENLPILKKDTITGGQSGSGNFFLMELN